jgi:IS5 family transposase
LVLCLALTPGNTSDIKGADLLLGNATRIKRVFPDRSYDANRLRAILRNQSAIPFIPGRRNCKQRIHYDQRRSKDRLRF